MAKITHSALSLAYITSTKVDFELALVSSVKVCSTVILTLNTNRSIEFALAIALVKSSALVLVSSA